MSLSLNPKLDATSSDKLKQLRETYGSNPPVPKNVANARYKDLTRIRNILGLGVLALGAASLGLIVASGAAFKVTSSTNCYIMAGFGLGGWVVTLISNQALDSIPLVKEKINKEVTIGLISNSTIETTDDPAVLINIVQQTNNADLDNYQHLSDLEKERLQLAKERLRAYAEKVASATSEIMLSTPISTWKVIKEAGRLANVDFDQMGNKTFINAYNVQFPSAVVK